MIIMIIHYVSFLGVIQGPSRTRGSLTFSNFRFENGSTCGRGAKPLNVRKLRQHASGAPEKVKGCSRFHGGLDSFLWATGPQKWFVQLGGLKHLKHETTIWQRKVSPWLGNAKHVVVWLRNSGRIRLHATLTDQRHECILSVGQKPMPCRPSCRCHICHMPHMIHHNGILYISIFIPLVY